MIKRILSTRLVVANQFCESCMTVREVSQPIYIFYFCEFFHMDEKENAYWLADLHCANCHNIFFKEKKIQIRMKNYLDICHGFVNLS